MQALIIYESIFGNTLEIAEAIASGLKTRFDVTVAEVEQSRPDIESVNFLVVDRRTPGA